jgi:rubrerythrin
MNAVPDSEVLEEEHTHTIDSQSLLFRNKLIALLQGAYSGELGASYAYQGHWRSAKDPEEIASIKKIEAEEWHHRALVGVMLEELGALPDPKLEKKLTRIGKTIGFLCRIGGWFMPMYGAGRLESHNVKEYQDAAEYAKNSGNEKYIDSLLEMAEVEREHERYFRLKVESHFLHRVFPKWKIPG